MNLRDIDPEKFIPMGHKKQAILVERIEHARNSKLIIPPEYAGPQMSSGLEPPVLTHFRPKICKVLSIGPRVTGVKPGDVVFVPGAGNCYPDWEDGTDIGSRVLIREGDIAFKYETTA